MRKLVVLLAALVAASALAAAELPAQAAGTDSPAGQVAKPTRVVASCSHLAVKPRRVVVTCADGNIYVVFRHYATWTHTAARGRGVYWINDCKPSCAGGTFHHYRAHLRLARVVKTRRGAVFSRLHVRYTTTNGTVHRVGYPLPTRPF